MRTGFEAVGRRIVDARKRLGWSQADLATRVGVSPAAVQKWEHGGGWEIATLLTVAECLGVPPAWLMEPLIGSLGPPDQAQLVRRIARLEQEAGELRRLAEGLVEGDGDLGG
jgi:transcriptional regulator with XRE-family HTH domain